MTDKIQKITEAELKKYFELSEEMSLMKKEKEKLGKKIKENLVSNAEQTIGAMKVSINETIRKTLQSKLLKEEQPGIFEKYAKEQKVKSLKVVCAYMGG